MDVPMNSMQKSKKKLFVLLSAAVLVLCATHSVPVYAQDKWLQLGEGQASMVSSSAYIRSDTAKGTVCALRLQVEGSGLEVDEITVHFGNSQTLHVVNQIKLGANAPLSSMQSIPLPGPRRTIKGIDIVYKIPDPGVPVPLVKLWGNSLPTALYCPK